MSDGGNATPGSPAPDDDGTNTWIPRTPRPAPATAPWERTPNFAGAPDENHEDSPGDAGPSQEGKDPGTGGGNHTDGVSVADLFARLTGDVPDFLQRADAEQGGRRRAAHAYPEDLDPPTDLVASAYASELPDLGVRENVPADDGEDTTRREAAAPAVRRRHPKVVLAGRVVAALMAVFALVLTGGAWQWTATKNNSLNTVAALDPQSRDIVDANAQFGDENFLIVGVDSRLGENAEMGAGDTRAAEGARSDTVMLVNIPASRNRVVAVSFPRDTAITPIKCRAWDARNGEYGPVWDESSQTYGPDQIYTETKLNSAYSFGGPKCLVKVIQKISGLSINRFMAIDFAGFSKMVDALGGVQVCSTTPLEDYELGTVLPSAGRQIVDGHTALNYVRARQVTTEYNGDYGRIKRQQMFLSALLRSLISNDTFFSLSKLNSVVNMFISDSYVDNIETKDLVDLGQSIQGVSAGRVTFITQPTTGITDQDGNEVPDNAAIRALFDAIINDDPLPGENDSNETFSPVTSASTTTTATTEPTSARASGTATTTPESPALVTEVVNAVTAAPEEVSVHVSNSTGQGGLGAFASTEFQNQGFTIDVPDDYPESLSSTTVMYSRGNEQAAATVAAALGTPRIQRVGGLGQVVHVVLGSDFTAVSVPPPSGSHTTVHITHSSGSSPTELPKDLTVTNGADTTCE
jgi:LCP family protein required for cell wall assembly